MTKLTAVWVSEKNSNFAILAPVISRVINGKTIITRGEGGFLECSEGWTKGDTIELPEGSFKVTKRVTKEGTTLPVIELL